MLANGSMLCDFGRSAGSEPCTVGQTILYSTPLIANKCEDIHGDIQGGSPSTLNPGRHLAGLDVTGLLPLHLSWITSDTASWTMVSNYVRQCSTYRPRGYGSRAYR